MRPETKALYPDNWVEISKVVIEESERTCQDCGRSDRDFDIILTTHHLDYDPSNNKRDNLVCLCQGCHLQRQAGDLRCAVRIRRILILMDMGQLVFPGMEATFSKRLRRVIEGKALATSRRSAGRARPGSGR